MSEEELLDVANWDRNVSEEESLKRLDAYWTLVHRLWEEVLRLPLVGGRIRFTEDDGTTEVRDISGLMIGGYTVILQVRKAGVVLPEGTADRALFLNMGGLSQAPRLENGTVILTGGRHRPLVIWPKGHPELLEA